MESNKIQFGTDGWRGLLDDEFTYDNAALAAQAFADYLIKRENNKPGISTAVGYDGRRNSAEFAELTARILAGNGFTCYLSDKVIPTPVLSFFVKENNLDAGVMITASHNPPQYNGIKFKDYYGGPFFTEETAKVEQLIGASPIKSANRAPVVTDMIELYYKQLEGYVDFQAIRNAGISIAIDSMSGAGCNYLELLLQKNGCRVSTIFDKCDSEFNGRLPEPIERNLSPLASFLVSNPGFSFGGATDGDADRAGILLEDGTWLSAQYTILLLNDYIVNGRKFNGGLVKTSSVTNKVRLLADENHPVFDVQVGFKYICEMMTAHEIAIGCEESGGFGYQNHIPERDGLLSILLIAEMIAKSGYKTLSEYFKVKKEIFGEIYYDRVDMHYDKPDRLELLPAIDKNPPEFIAGFETQSIRQFYSSRGIVNGIKLYLEGDSRWLLIRASETEPLLRFYAEAENIDEVKEILNAGKVLTGCIQ